MMKGVHIQYYTVHREVPHVLKTTSRFGFSQLYRTRKLTNKRTRNEVDELENVMNSNLI